MSYYAVARGRKPGIYHTWDECKSQVHGFSGPIYKKFKLESEAKKFIETNSTSLRSTAPAQQCSIGTRKPGFTQNNKASKWRPSQNVSHGNGFSKSAFATKRPLGQSSAPPAKRFAKASSWRATSSRVTTINAPNGLVCHTVCTEYAPDKTTVKDGLEYAEDGSVIVYTDGACSQNGRRNSLAGMGVFWATGHRDNRSVPLALDERQTNNRAEIQAAVIAINLAAQRGHRRVTIRTDSKFMIQSVTQWLPGWLKKGWTLSTGKPVVNRTDFEDLMKAMAKLERVTWQHVPGHANIAGNEEADRLAREAITR